MYLPTMDARQRKEITEEFFHYRRLTQTQLWDQYSAYEHWAKIEVLIYSRYAVSWIPVSLNLVLFCRELLRKAYYMENMFGSSAIPPSGCIYILIFFIKKKQNVIM